MVGDGRSPTPKLNQNSTLSPQRTWRQGCTSRISRRPARIPVLAWALLIGAHELNRVNLIPAGHDVGCERDFNAGSLEGGFGKCRDQIVQVFRRVVALPDGVSSALLIKNFNLDDGA